MKPTPQRKRCIKCRRVKPINEYQFRTVRRKLKSGSEAKPYPYYANVCKACEYARDKRRRKVIKTLDKLIPDPPIPEFPFEVVRPGLMIAYDRYGRELGRGKDACEIIGAMYRAREKKIEQLKARQQNANRNQRQRQGNADLPGGAAKNQSRLVRADQNNHQRQKHLPALRPNDLGTSAN